MSRPRPRTRLIALAVALAVACAPTNPDHVARECVPLRAAVTAPALNEGLVHGWQQTVHWSQPIVYTDTDVELVLSYEQLPAGNGGHYEAGSPARIRIDPDYAAFTVPIVVHELGHHMGLAHTTESGAVMNPNQLNQTFTLDERQAMVDVNELC